MESISLCRKYEKATLYDYDIRYDYHYGCKCSQETYYFLRSKLTSVCRIICDARPRVRNEARFSESTCRCANPARANRYCADDVCVNRARDRIWCVGDRRIGECDVLVNEAGRSMWPECPCMNGGNRTGIGESCECAEYYYGEWCQDYRRPTTPGSSTISTSTASSSTSTSTIRTSTISTLGPLVVAYTREAEVTTTKSEDTPPLGLWIIVAIALSLAVLLCACVNYVCYKQAQRSRSQSSHQGPRVINDEPNENGPSRPMPPIIINLPSPNNSTAVIRRSPQQPQRPRAPPPPYIEHEDPSAPMLPVNSEDPPPSYDEVTRNSSVTKSEDGICRQTPV